MKIKLPHQINIEEIFQNLHANKFLHLEHFPTKITKSFDKSNFDKIDSTNDNQIIITKNK